MRYIALHLDAQMEKTLPFKLPILLSTVTINDTTPSSSEVVSLLHDAVLRREGQILEEARELCL
jgi:hypothetical protein